MTRLGLDFPTKWGRGYTIRFARHVFNTYFMNPYVRHISTLEVRGVEHVEGERPFIFVANHASHADTSLLFTSIPKKERSRTVVAAAMDSFFMDYRQAIKTVFLFNAIPVDRLKVNRRSAQLALELVEDGWNLIIYPEGGRTPDGRLQEFKGGAAYLAERSKATVIPTYIHDSGYLNAQKYAKAPIYVDAPHERRHHVVVAFGSAMRCEEGENMRHFGVRIERAVEELGRDVSGDENYGRREAVE
ncbi:MAG TPA: lysophospholipid acyltransferase family protein [Acidimicrobiales bacterium]|jgi:1-acyl-sn-glycerol-3-phosphate acyltransferase